MVARTLVIEGDDLPFGDQLGEAAAGDHQDQGGNEGLDLEHGDEDAVPQSAGEPDARPPRATTGSG